MTAPVRLLLVRHGEVDANRELRYLGRSDPRLNPTGRLQAARLADTLAALRVDRVLTSPLRRARETAVLIADRAGRHVEIEPRLAEMSFGAWEGQTRAQVLAAGQQQASQLLRWERDPRNAPPGGESLASVRVRSLALVAELRRSARGSTVALVSHVGPIKAMLCVALGLPLRAARRMFLDPASVSVVDWGSRPVLRLFNAPDRAGLGSARWAGEGGGLRDRSAKVRSKS